MSVSDDDLVSEGELLQQPPTKRMLCKICKKAKDENNNRDSPLEAKRTPPGQHARRRNEQPKLKLMAQPSTEASCTLYDRETKW